MRVYSVNLHFIFRQPPSKGLHILFRLASIAHANQWQNALIDATWVGNIEG
jgi:hypothetical protein